MTHVYADMETALEVLTPNDHVFNLMIDNITFYPKTPDDHQFAGILVAKEDAQLFIANLAKAMGVQIEIIPEFDWDESSTPAATASYDREDNVYTISGDLRDFLTLKEEEAVAEKYVEAGFPAGDYRTVNYMVADLAANHFGSQHEFDFDPESSCFFAYCDTQAGADAMLDYLNEKEFLK